MLLLGFVILFFKSIVIKYVIDCFCALLIAAVALKYVFAMLLWLSQHCSNFVLWYHTPPIALTMVCAAHLSSHNLWVDKNLSSVSVALIHSLSLRAPQELFSSASALMLPWCSLSIYYPIRNHTS
jgi:hypothetical protein